MNAYLNEVDWDVFFQNVDIDESIDKFTKFILDVAKSFIPFGVKTIRKSCHPWLNEKCKRLVIQKHTSFGTPNYENARETCSQGLFEEYSKYVDHATNWLEDNVKSQKSWWHYSKNLLLRKMTIRLYQLCSGVIQLWYFLV